MAYNIRNSVGTVVATIADNSVDTSTSITLIGKNFVGYGEKQNQNFYYLLENFAKSTSPSNPVVGQLWYDTGNSVLKVYNGSVFNDISSTISNGNSNVRIAANSNVTVAVTGTDRVTFATTGMTVVGNILPSANITYNLGSTSFRWANIWGVSSSALYADLAEKYYADTNYDAGTVIKLGGTREITICNEECSKDVFGCISLAPAYLMNNNDVENYLPVVLLGRSVIKVIGKANKGDRLVSAGNGYARKAETEELNYQTEIGRLLVDKNYEEVGLVEAFISTK